MDVDYHYYGTYVAACFAGFSKEDAEIIAHAAQYTDDAEAWRNHMFPTVYFGWDWESISKYFGSSYPSLDQIRYAFVPFHFLPGNADLRQRYTGPTSHKSSKEDWTWDDKAKWAFKLMCLSQSSLLEAVINNIIADHGDTDYINHLAGIAMHVLADTGAHMYFAGTPAWHVNDVGPDVFNITDNRNEKIEFISPLGDVCNPSRNGKEVHTESSEYHNNIVYTSHCRLGHIPDYPWINYRYNPMWKDSVLEKNNLEEYVRTFKEMVLALTCIREKKKFKFEDSTKLDKKINEEIENVVRKILFSNQNICCYKEGDTLRCKAWTNELSSGGKLSRFGLPGEYDKEKWMKEAGLSELHLNLLNGRYFPDIYHYDFINYDFYKFDKAARVHQIFVLSELEKEKIILDNHEGKHYENPKGDWIFEDVTHTGLMKLERSGENIAGNFWYDSNPDRKGSISGIIIGNRINANWADSENHGTVSWLIENGKISGYTKYGKWNATRIAYVNPRGDWNWEDNAIIRHTGSMSLDQDGETISGYYYYDGWPQIPEYKGSINGVIVGNRIIAHYADDTYRGIVKWIVEEHTLSGKTDSGTEWKATRK